MSQFDLLVAVRREDANRYYQHLSAHPEFGIRIVSDLDDAIDTLSNSEHHVDVLVDS